MVNLLLALIYVSFISLGLPDSLLGSAWPVLHKQLQVPVSYAGIISMIMFGGTRGIAPETAAGLASLFYIGITVGRGINGFLAMKFGDHFLIRMGLGIICAGILLVCIPFHANFAMAGFIIIGLGCAPIYPCIIHMTPDVFGKDRSQAMIGVQMAFAYTGFMLMPSFFGLIANHISIALLPVYLFVFLILMVVMHEIVIPKNRK